MLGLNDHVTAINESTNGYVRRRKITDPCSVRVVVQEAQKFVATTCVGMWWPEQVYKQKFQKEIAAHNIFRYEGANGIWLDVDQG